ncbi:MAG: hypothetical protein IJN86_01275 [Clostridia bacterium]|nr:hypothetical protein [Clostridia bacterium]
MANRRITFSEDYKKAYVTKAFATKARTYGTFEFKEWREVTAQFKGIKMEIRKPKRQNAFKLTYENMETFIKSQPDSEELIKKFETVKASSKLTRSPISYVKRWFEQTFKDNEDYKALKNIENDDQETDTQEITEEKASA